MVCDQDITSVFSAKIFGLHQQCIDCYETTVPPFNSSTNCMDSPGKIHERAPDWRPVPRAWMTSQLNVL